MKCHRVGWGGWRYLSLCQKGISTMIDIATTPIPHDGTSSATTAAGVPQERVDPYTLQIIDHLFPAHHGLDILAKLLRQAQVKQLALPNLGLPEVTDVAVIAVKSLRKLAELIKVSYDTTEKYILLFSSLRLLWKQRRQQEITLHFPL